MFLSVVNFDFENLLQKQKYMACFSVFFEIKGLK